MRGFRAVAAASLALFATAANAAQPVAQAKPCLTSAEGSALFLALMPDAIQSTITVCAKTLPANAYLSARGSALVARYRAPANAARRDAVAALAKIASDKSIDEQMFEMVAGPMVGALIAQEVKPETCGRINQIFELFDPMPPENISRLIVTILEMTSEGPKAKAAPFEFCKAGD